MNILAFCAHPDDIELNVGGTLLKYKKQATRSSSRSRRAGIRGRTS